MSTAKRPRRGSLQFYPRKRASKLIPSVNWKPLKKTHSGLLGFITYKVGMASAIVKDLTEKSSTNGKEIVLPVTILEVPPMKIFSVRFYKNSILLSEQIVSTDKELKRKLRLPKTAKNLEKTSEDYDEIRVIAYSIPKYTSIKKTPDLIEISVNSENPLESVKPLLNKEISLDDLFNAEMVDVRGLTKGKGFQGPVKRFGIKLRQHKSEKGRRNPGSIGPWHPAHVTFRTPMPGQLGMFSRVHYNLKIIEKSKISDKDINPSHGFKNYGKIKTSYLIVSGSVQGPAKRQILITPSFRPSKNTSKKKYEFQEVVVK